MRILIADDDPQLLRALRITLTAEGYEIVTATDGAEAIQVAIDHHPDIFMPDLGMPRMDGIQVIHGIRGWSTAPILVVSGRTGSADKVEALDAGADDLRLYISQLRKKLEPDPSHPRYLITESGMGYRLRTDPSTNR